MTLMVWSFQTVRVIFLIWQQFLKILKVEKNLILRAFRGAKSDIKFEFYEDTWNQRITKSEERGKSKGIGFRKESFMIFDEDLCIKRMKTLPQKRIKEIALWHRVFSDIRFWENHKSNKNLWKPSKINTFKQFFISPKRMFLGRKIPRNSFLGDFICFWEHFWENKTLFGKINPNSGKRELPNIRRCCYA